MCAHINSGFGTCVKIYMFFLCVYVFVCAVRARTHTNAASLESSMCYLNYTTHHISEVTYAMDATPIVLHIALEETSVYV